MNPENGEMRFQVKDFSRSIDFFFHFRQTDPERRSWSSALPSSSFTFRLVPWRYERTQREKYSSASPRTEEPKHDDDVVLVIPPESKF